MFQILKINTINKMNIKNTITNILGLVFWGIAVKDALSEDPKISFIVSLLIIGIVLFLFQVKTTIDFVKRFLNKNIDAGKN